MTLRTVSVRLRAEVADYIGKIKASGVATKDFVGELNKAAKAGQLDAVASMAGRAGLALSGGFLLAAGAAARFDQQMSHVNAVTNGTATELDRLRTAALDAGKATQFSATEAAKAEEELAKAGIATADILGGGLAGALDLAAAGTIDLAEAADIAAKTMNVFNLEGEDVPHIADVLAASANKSATDVHEMGEALRMGGLAARNAGMSLEDTVGTLSAFADNALIGSDAGTSLKTMLQFLANPTAKAASLMQELGIKVYDAQGNFLGVEKVAGILQERLGALTQEQRQAALATIFGADATRAATVLYDLGEQGVREYIEAVDDQGAAQDTARKKTDNLVGDIERLKGSLETLFIEAGGGANSGLRTLVKALDGVVGVIAGLPQPVLTAATVLSGVGGAGLLAAGGFIKARSTATDLLGQLREMGPAGERAATGLGKIGSAVSKASLWALGIFAVYEASKLFIQFLERDVKPVTRDVNEMGRALRELADDGRVAGELEKAFGPKLQRLRTDFEALNIAAEKLPQGLTGSKSGLGELGRGMVDAGRQAAHLNDEIEKAGRQAGENFRAVDKALAELVRSGGTTQAKIAFEELAETWTAAGLPLSELKALLPEYAKAVGEAGLASSATGRGLGTVAANARTVATGLQAAVDAGQKLTEVFDQLNGAAVDWAKAEIELEKAVDAAAESIEKNGKTLDVNSEKGRANRESLLDIVDATRTAIQAKFDETGSLQEATRVYEEGRQALIKSAMQAGATRAEAEKLAAQWLKMPPIVQTSIATPGMDDALKRVQAYRRELGAIPSSVNTKIVTSGGGGKHSTGKHERWGGVYEHARMGLLSEAAVYSPREPARYAFAEPATGGEAFVPKHGDRDRSLGVLGTAASWYGMSMVPWQAMRHTAAVSQSEPQPTPIVHVYLGDRRLEEIVDVRVEYAMDATARQVMSGVRA